MKKITFKDLHDNIINLEVGCRENERSSEVRDIIISKDSTEFIIEYGADFKVFRGIPFVYTEFNANKNPYKYEGRKD